MGNETSSKLLWKTVRNDGGLAITSRPAAAQQRQQAHTTQHQFSGFGNEGQVRGKRPKIHPLGMAPQTARLRPCLLQKHPGLGDVTDGPLTRGSWRWRCPQLSLAP